MLSGMQFIVFEHFMGNPHGNLKAKAVMQFKEIIMQIYNFNLSHSSNR